MDPKRKRLYIILIVSSILLSSAVILWGRSSPPSLPPAPVTQTTAPATSGAGNAKARSLDQAYPAPAVFPANNTFDTKVLNSSMFKSLQDYQAATVDASQLGRDDPFKSY